MKKQVIIALLAIISLTIPAATIAQTPTKEASVKVTGEVITPLTITGADLHLFTQITVARKDRDGKDHTYLGVTLSDILQKAGATMGQQLKGENLAKYLLVEASDGYQVVFALAELDKSFTDRMIILADTVDGKPLAAGDGPFRIIVQDEKKPARCIKQVTGMKVIFAK
jgi:DMSO/TMAO reductase YedYZ molybdopterin-dependent catalytic subunit